MNFRLHFQVFALAGAVGTASLALLGCSRSEVKPNANAPRVVRAVQVDASRQIAHETTSYTGVVRARTESNLGFRVAGKIAERLVNAGDAVKKGQPLLKLDPTDYELALQAARAVHQQAALELERVRVLVEKRAESRDALERASAAAETSAAQTAQIANQASYTTLFADADGVVMSTLAEPGQVVAAGQPVLVLAKNGLREAAVDIPESSLDRISGAKATAQLYLNAALNVPATFREISGVADPVARTYQARYVLDGDAARFPLGATITVRISTAKDAAQPTLEIPLGSLLDRGDGASVWVIDPKTSAVAKRSVTIAKLGEETASISGGLQPGETIVGLGAQLLQAGDVVRAEKLSVKDAR
ncbi:MAG: efflux RND transporter periplasmic adaptor subunit [Candidatus Didemnitutus sp.]|nr:efflux RND transporter periplasmic adaptor subunit [Candidatus Didemnitutus sp.]